MTPDNRTVVAAGNRVGGILWIRGMERSRDSQARSSVRTLVRDAKTFQMFLKGLFESKDTVFLIANGLFPKFVRGLLLRSSSVHERYLTFSAKLGSLTRVDRNTSCLYDFEISFTQFF